MSLTFIACYRDRDGKRLQRSLDSLRAQTCRDFDLILLDYGSGTAWSAAIQRLVAQFPFCRYAYSDSFNGDYGSYFFKGWQEARHGRG
jgi:glycosyltransferase involved in cell wall biosynthesis